MNTTPYTIECDRDGMWVCRIEKSNGNIHLTVHRNARRATEYGSAMTMGTGDTPCPSPWMVLS